MLRNLFFVFLVVILPVKLQAKPVSFPDSWMIMQMNNHMAHSVEAIYSPTARYAFGVRSEYMREGEEWVHSGVYNRLLKRWNAPDSQGNLYMLTGLGVAQNRGDTEPAISAGMAADWETRRIYFAYENRYLHADNVSASFSQMGRVGFAPYVGGYDDIHTWLILQVNHHPELKDNIVVTPIIRLFNTSVLGEVGISHKKDVLFNITYQF
jgi:hypothetical protein